MEILEVHGENPNILPNSDYQPFAGQYSYLPFYVMQEMEYTCSSNGNQSGKICIGSHGSFVYSEEITSYCYCVTKRSKKTPFPAEKKGILNCMCHSIGPMVFLIPEREHNGVLS